MSYQANDCMRMFTPNNTWAARYDAMGVTGYIHQYANGHENVLHVIDVGCSDGTAAEKAKQCLQLKKVQITTTGIDCSPSIKADASRNLDNFELGDVRSPDMDKYKLKADVVIYVNVGNWFNLLEGHDTKEIFQRCLEFLKSDGILITDASDAKRFAQDNGLIRRNIPHPAMLCPNRWNRLRPWIRWHKATTYKKSSHNSTNN